MQTLSILGLQFTISLFLFGFMAKWLAEPHYLKGSGAKVLQVFLLINSFRYLPLSLYMPGQVADGFPDTVKHIVALGDFASGITAIIAMLLVHTKSSQSKAAVWFFSIVSTLDMVMALSGAIGSRVDTLPLGANYFTVVVYVPMLLVIQLIIYRILIKGPATLWKS
ncbi:MAG TPA: hypothetical protein DCG19_02150 [Cryomorphaceae bacterium]|nr:hypothetical protein [Owenweeksia sp.]MBF99381.1 hypothetical protein [Owenweeksia sp.]HAD96174.1 hypothetical protein [Cryomorphaceae bacterium]HBF19455.1 hypothetical protein [Cryomorphaceae bacterium]HCQ16813.1 hypothetical protein [Cryomorphaceae bacterium]|tara:strand:- start:27 stop:524 length:498 start_codon:yes stop_codon:yes gene_type:complete